LPGVVPEMIKADFCRGRGQEWLGKIRAIHSSAALAANTFGRWKTEPEKLKLVGLSGFQSPALEAQCRTGLVGTPPNLDVLLQSSNVVIGIESKFLELLTPKMPKFTASYSRGRLPLCENTWWSFLEHVSHMPKSHLDAAQLIKHYLGLRKQFSHGKRVFLLYLYWKPFNAEAFPEYAHHDEDLYKFQNAVQSSDAVHFIAMDYLTLWKGWEKDKHMGQHAKLLMNRYSVEI